MQILLLIKVMGICDYRYWSIGSSGLLLSLQASTVSVHGSASSIYSLWGEESIPGTGSGIE
jgi:hypothetical protein